MNTYEFNVIYRQVDQAKTQTKLSVLTKMVTPETKPQPTTNTTNHGYL